MRAVPVEEYRRQMKVRSPKWGTVMLPSAAFQDLVRPFRDFVSSGVISRKVAKPHKKSYSFFAS